MASYHCTVKSGGKGRAGKHADYVSREGKYAPELTRGTSKLEDLEHKASGNMPAWAAHDAGVFWKAADEHERANGSTYREVEVALPRELNPAQRQALVEDFIAQQIGDLHPFTYAIHIPKAAIEKGDQPHAHIMYSERTLDGIARDPELFFKRANTKNPERGGCKKASGGKLQAERKAELLEIRERWANVQNKHLELAGVDARVTHLSLRAQGIDRTPEMHLGPVLAKQHAPALREHRAAERELAQAPQVNAAAELAAQAQQAQQQADQAEAQQREAARQAQAQAAAQQAQREAAEAARQEQARAAAVQAEREAEAAAQAAAAAAAQAAAQAEREAALNAQLTAEKEEKENDRVRETALAALAKSSRATGRSITFAVADHSAIGSAVESSRKHINQSIELAGDSRTGLASAVAGAERRVFRENINRSAPAVRDQLGQAHHLFQQLVEYLPRVVTTIAAAAKEVTQQLQKAAAKASERPTAAAPAPAQHPEIDRITFHTAADKELAEHCKELYASTTQPSEAQRSEFAIAIQTAIRDAVATSRATAPAANPTVIERDTKAEHNREAARAGKMEPWPQGQSNCALHVPAANAQRELDAHCETRPALFGRKEHDAKTAALQSKHREIADAAKAAEARLAREVAERIAAARQQDAQNAPKHAHAEQRIESLKALEKIAQRARSAVQKSEPSKDHDHGTGSDFGR